MHLRDQSYLKSTQYINSHNLEARIALHQRFSTNPQDWFRWKFDQLKLPVSGRVLDLGCGPGDLWYSNYSQIPAMCHLFLSDLSAGMVTEGHTRIDKLIKRIDYSVSDAQDLPFPAECFQVVLANHMLHHTPDIERALSEIRRVMKPGALLFATTIGETHLSGRLFIHKDSGMFVAEVPSS
jgi:ubiquinone/menaquinone biosynthesis C-methylase UbiE